MFCIVPLNAAFAVASLYGQFSRIQSGTLNLSSGQPLVITFCRVVSELLPQYDNTTRQMPNDNVVPVVCRNSKALTFFM